MSWAELTKSNTNGSKTEFAKFDAGVTTTIRCLTSEPVVRWSHFIQSAKRSVTCAGRGKCPICEANESAKSNGVQAPYSTSKKFALIIYNYATEKVEILEQGTGFFEQLYAFHTDEDFGDLREYDIKVKRMGVKTNTSYSLIPGAKSEFDAEGLGVDLNNLPDLAKQFNPPTREQTLALMEGKSPQEVFGNNSDNNYDEKDETVEY